jgi:hypothetical protein
MRNEITTTLGKRCHSDALPTGLKQLVDRRLDQARSALDQRDPGSVRHMQALASFGNHLGERGPDPTDPRMWTLWQQQGVMGGTDSFDLGEAQTNLLARLGAWGAAPDPETTLNELVAAGTEDVIALLQKQVGEANAERDAALEAAAQNEAGAAKATVLEGKLAEAQERISGFAGELAEASAKVQYMSEMGIPDNQQEKQPRRTRVDGETGIYFYDTAAGREYEAVWRADGKQMRAKAGPDLKAAIARRAELVGAAEPVAA